MQQIYTLQCLVPVQKTSETMRSENMFEGTNPLNILDFNQNKQSISNIKNKKLHFYHFNLFISYIEFFHLYKSTKVLYSGIPSKDPKIAPPVQEAQIGAKSRGVICNLEANAAKAWGKRTVIDPKNG